MREDESCPDGVLDELVLALSFLRTIERYASAILGPEDVDGVCDDIVVFKSWEERTNGTRLRRIPAPKTR